MFGKKKKTKMHNHIDTLIGANTNITGDINFSGGLRIDGHINGNVIAEDEEQSTLVLSDAGHIEGKIQVANVIINGTVTGPIHAFKYLELQGNAQIHGDVHYGAIEIKLGASVDGKMIHQDKLQSEKMVTLIPVAPE
ncbi:cytoskeletal protein CcmA (bactofilin family) [Nitrosomonas aestuarii]|nr:polymer-forming cytoskeletal protein [Nitrosomonas aestuarii]PTN11033.1 cytoskeletal protein CcmA (bactofilin family) [Nitrosomonas aestuarii]